jgi:adenylate cyclase
MIARPLPNRNQVDEVTAYFAPGFAENQNHAHAAVKAGQEILTATGHDGADKPWVPVGVGIHTGVAYVGAVGQPGKNIDIAVLGDNVNIASRLAGQAKAGEIVLSDVTRRKAGLDNSDLEFRSLTLKGKGDPIDTWIYRSGAG